MWFLLLLALVACSKMLEAAQHESVHVHDLNNDEHRRHFDAGLPDYLEFKFKRGETEGETVLRLTKAEEQMPNVPFDILGGDGTLVESHEDQKHERLEDMAYYNDDATDGNFLVTCKIAKTGPCVRQITGYFTAGDKHYELQPAFIDHDAPATRTVQHVLRQDDLKKFNDDVSKVDAQGFVEDFDESEAPADYVMPEEDEGLKANVENETEKGAMIERRQFNLIKGDASTPSPIMRKPTTYTIEMSVLIDESFYDQLLPLALDILGVSRSRKIKDTSNFKYYVGLLAANRARMMILGMYQRYRRMGIKLRVTLKKGVIITSMNGTGRVFMRRPDGRILYAPTEKTDLRTDADGKTYIEGSTYLMRIQRWYRWQVRTKYYGDLFMVITGYDLYRNKDITDNGMTGLTYFGSLCSKHKSIAVIEAGGMFFMTYNAAHELGHSIGSGHDGSPYCSPWNRHIMMSRRPIYPYGMITSKDPWMFSDCTKKAIRKELPNLSCVKDDHYYDMEKSYVNWYYTRRNMWQTEIENQCYFNQGADAQPCDMDDVIDTPDVCKRLRCSPDCTINYFAANETRCSPVAEQMYCVDGFCKKAAEDYWKRPKV